MTSRARAQHRGEGMHQGQRRLLPLHLGVQVLADEEVQVVVEEAGAFAQLRPAKGRRR